MTRDSRLTKRLLGVTLSLLVGTSAAWFGPWSSARPQPQPPGHVIDLHVLERARTWEAGLRGSVPRGDRRAGRPHPNSWRGRHVERSQSLAAYRRTATARRARKRTTIYLVRMGTLSPEHEAALEHVAGFCLAYFGRPGRLLDRPDLQTLDTALARPSGDSRQLSSRTLLERLAAVDPPEDALAILGFTAEDLFPEPGWSFVFGHAARDRRAAVISFHRMGDPRVEPTNVLSRALKTSAHELGHVLGMLHCTEFECNQAGVRTREDRDRRPPHLCPTCRDKIQFALEYGGIERDVALLTFYVTHELRREAVFVYRRLMRGRELVVTD